MKHKVLSADALTKFVIIASASRGTETAGSNMMRTAQATNEVMSLGRTVQAFEMVTGFYRENIALDGAYEQSMAIGVTSTTTMKSLIALFCLKYDQECVLVWNCDTNSVWLMNEQGFLAELGKHGLRRTWSSLHAAEFNNWLQPDAFTVAADGSIWEVR